MNDSHQPHQPETVDPDDPTAMALPVLGDTVRLSNGHEATVLARPYFDIYDVRDDRGRQRKVHVTEIVGYPGDDQPLAIESGATLPKRTSGVPGGIVAGDHLKGSGDFRLIVEHISPSDETNRAVVLRAIDPAVAQGRGISPDPDGEYRITLSTAVLRYYTLDLAAEPMPTSDDVEEYMPQLVAEAASRLRSFVALAEPMPTVEPRPYRLGDRVRITHHWPDGDEVHEGVVDRIDRVLARTEVMRLTITTDEPYTRDDGTLVQEATVGLTLDATQVRWPSRDSIELLEATPEPTVEYDGAEDGTVGDSDQAPTPPERTPAIERAVEVLADHKQIVAITGDPVVVALDLLAHTLNADEMARALHALHRINLETCSDCEFRAKHLRTHILGGAL